MVSVLRDNPKETRAMKKYVTQTSRKMAGRSYSNTEFLLWFPYRHIALSGSIRKAMIYKRKKIENGENPKCYRSGKEMY
jgi:hypothetical protein